MKYFIASIAIVFMPLLAPLESVFADDCTPPTNGQQPSGPSASLFTYDCGTGLWASSHYTFDPSTGNYTSTDPVTYTYDPSTENYDYTTWQYDADTNSYDQVSESTPTPPLGATIVGAPTSDNSSSDSSDNIAADSNDADTADPTAQNQDSSNDNNTASGNSGNNATVSNQLTSDATSGDASVTNNVNAGDATTGDATDTATVENLLQSTSNALGNNALTFVADIDGDVNGDLLLDPSVVASIPNNSTNSSSITLNNTNSDTINNTINLTATSGNANVSNNVNGGSATTGNAETIADVVNVIDAAISSGKSFLGIININGDLNGNIVMPADFVNQLLAANVPTVNIQTNSSTSTNLTNTNNNSISNNVTETASTGAANVNANVLGGNAATGNASTEITAFNLTNSQIIGSNDLLVFVNVAGGKWVGLIVNAPSGATAAEFGSGISENNSETSNSNIEATNTNNAHINNNINLSSKSGDATVSNNVNGGNATSGNADAAVNLLNVENSDISLSNWFGILFINVFGTWNGNFGMQTASTTAGPLSKSGADSGTNMPGSFMAAQSKAVAVGFVPHSAKSSSSSSKPNSSGTGSIGGNGSGTNVGGSILTDVKNESSQIPKPAIAASGHVKWSVIISGVAILTVYLLGERYYAARQAARLKS